MFLQLQQQSLLLGRRPLGFTEHYYTEWDDGLGKEKIALFLLISVSSTQVPSAEIAKEAFQLLQDHFLDDLAGDPYERFENALREINHMALEKEKELEVKFMPNVHMLIGVVQKDYLFISQRGDAHGYLLRKRHVSSITEGLFDEKNKEDLFQNIASGVLEVGDNVVFVTGPLVQYVTPTDLAKIFSEQNLAEAAKELEQLLHPDVEDQMAMLAFEVLEKTEELRPAVHAQKMGDEEEEAAMATHAKMDLEDEDTPSKRNKTKEQVSKAVARLREFALKEDRFSALRQVRHWEKKKLLSAIVVLFVLGVVGTLVLRQTLGEQKKINEFQAKLDQAEANISLASTRGTFDKAEAATLLDEAQTLAVEVLDSGYLGSTASQTLDDIEEQRDFLDNVFHVDDELKLVADFSDKMSSGGQIIGVEAHSDQLVVFTDTQAFQVLTDQVQTPDSIDSAEKVIAARSFSDYNAVVLLTFAGKLMEYSEGNSQFADTADVDWKSGLDVATYSNKIYILNPSENQIWRYQKGNSGYSGAQAYLPEGEDLRGAVSLAVDGDVWVLKSDGTLLQYYAGEAVEYTVKKAPLTVMESGAKVFTELDMNRIYVLDSKAKRVLVYDKSSKNDDLTYASQYVFDDLDEDITDIHVDKERNVLMLTTKSALYEISFTE
ncbi:hypothetical protein IPG41_02670 [Candidatus Peregrinibacteria bacterium]|nr:MAG: hypothetical protein IPG41_02670 [Candidatus Peregrinibacteria bacterium]